MNNTFWSKAGIILGILLVIVNILLSISAYNDPDIRHPESFSDLKIVAYPNSLLGFPVIITSGLIDAAVSPFYRVQQYSSIPDDPNLYNIYNANKQTRDDRRSASLFIQLFIVLSLYWFIVGTFLVWIYNKLSKVNKIFYIVLILLIVFGAAYISLVTLNPKPYNPQVEVNKLMQR